IRQNTFKTYGTNVYQNSQQERDGKKQKESPASSRFSGIFPEYRGKQGKLGSGIVFFSDPRNAPVAEKIVQSDAAKIVDEKMTISATKRFGSPWNVEQC